MTIKDFAHKNGLTFFWLTMILAIIILLALLFDTGKNRRYEDAGFRDRNFDRNNKAQMMNRDRDGYEQNQNLQTEEEILPSLDTNTSQTQ